MENSYEQLIDDYNNGILVQAGESLTDYISRMGGVNYPDKKADGGIMRVDLSEGTPSKRDELVERFGVKSDLLKKVYPLFMDEDGDYRKALQIAKYELSKFISGKGTDLDTGAEWYNKLDKDTQKEILEEKIKIREKRPEMYKKFDIKPSPQMVEEMEMPVYDEEYAGKYGIGGRYADGGVAGILKV